MTTINAKNGEFVNLINGLFAIQELPGKDFSLVVSRNIAILKENLKEIEEAGVPSTEFMELANQVNEIANTNSEDSKDQIDKLEKDNQELVDSRRAQMDKIQEMMEEKTSMDLHILSEAVLPEEITAKQINNILKIIK
tara:strand:- start:890 stop:1303 length:414 start_codon:yes stop_codon:yes gene_type:complete